MSNSLQVIKKRKNPQQLTDEELNDLMDTLTNEQKRRKSNVELDQLLLIEELLCDIQEKTNRVNTLINELPEQVQNWGTLSDVTRHLTTVSSDLVRAKRSLSKHT